MAPDDEKTIWIPAKRLLEVLDQANIGPRELGESGTRKINDFRMGRQEAVTLYAADRLLTRVGLVHWVHVLADECADYEPSWVEAARRQLETLGRPGQRKYATDAERREARRLRRLTNTCQKCGAATGGKLCVPCWRSRGTAHGTVWRYMSKDYRCRCPECRAAVAAYKKQYKLRLEEAA